MKCVRIGNCICDGKDQGTYYNSMRSNERTLENTNEQWPVYSASLITVFVQHIHDNGYHERDIMIHDNEAVKKNTVQTLCPGGKIRCITRNLQE